MVNPGTFRGLRLGFLNAQNDDYAAAVESGDVDAFIQSTQHRYFKRFPITLDHDKDPTQEWLAQVDDNAPEEEIKAPDRDNLSADEYALALANHEALMLNLKKRKESIKRRLQYRYAKTRGEDEAAATKGAPSSLAVLTAKLMGKNPSKPRMKTAYNLWGPQHRDITDPVFDARVKDGNVPASQQLALRSSVYKELFEKLSDAEKADWAERAEEEHFNNLAEYKTATTGSPSTKPADRQRVITAVPKLIAPILDLVAAYTGWQWTLMGGGPEPADDGRLNMLSIHSGVMPGTVRMDFGRAERQAYREHIQPTFGRYLTRCYTVEECRSRALPRNHAEPLLASIAEEEDFDHRRFDRNDNVKLAQSKTIPDPARASKGGQSGDSSKRTASGSDAQDNGLTKQARPRKAVAKESRSTSGSSRSANSALDEPQSTGVGSNSTKIGPPRGKKPQRVAPTGANNKELAPLRSNEAQKTALESTDTQEPAHLVADAGGLGVARTGSGACAARTTVRSSSQPILASSHPLTGTIPNTRRAASQPIAPSNGSLGTPAPIAWKAKPASVRSMSMAPSRAGSQAPALGFTPPPSRASSRGPSPPPSRAPSCEPSLPPQVPSHPPPPSPPMPQPCSAPHTPLRLARSTTSTAMAASIVSPIPVSSASPTPRASRIKGTVSEAAPTTSGAAAIALPPPAAILSTPSSPIPSATLSTIARATSSEPSTSTAVNLTPSTSAAPRRIPSGAAAVPDNDALDAVVGNNGTSRKHIGRGGVATALKETAVGSKRKASIEASKPRKKLRGEGGASISPRAFEVCLPSHCPEWIEKAILLFTAEDLGPEWRALVGAWLKFEERFDFAKSGPTLSSSHRPTAISDWIKHARKPNFRPNLNNLQDFERSFWQWWKAVQPDWRSDDDNDSSAIGTMTRTRGGDWDTLRVFGQNGLLSVVAALCFWGMAAGGNSVDVDQWSLAVTDVHYALCQLVI